MADVHVAPNFGTELKNGFKPVNNWIQGGIAWLDDIQSYYRERSSIEREYGQKLNALAKKYHEKRSRKQSVVSVGETPTVTPGSLESASMTTWGVHLTTLESRATEHERLAAQLVSSIAEPLKLLAVHYEDIRKIHADHATKLERERDNSYTDLRKTKTKYDSICQEVENRRKKTEGTTDHARGKAQSVFQQQQEDMRNTKNTYLIAINITNKQKERYYHEYVPNLLSSLQDLSETSVKTVNTLWSKAATLEAQTLDNCSQLSHHVATEVARNDPPLDSVMFIRHNVANWHEPSDFAFEPSPVWHDDDTMAIDPDSKTFLRNILLKSKATKSEYQKTSNEKQREIDNVKRTRQAIRDGKDKRDEVEVVRAQFAMQEALHDLDRKRMAAEVEISTISSAAGDLSIGARKHAFKAQTFKIPTNCDHCGERIWGLSAKGFDCTACGFTCHNKCELKVPSDCPGDIDKEQRKKLKVERQAAVQAAARVAPPPVDEAVAHRPSADGSRLSRSDTIGSMNTLSSGYTTSAQRSASGNLKPVEDVPVATPTSPSNRRNRLVAPPPERYADNVPDSTHGSDKATVLYAYTKNGDDELSVTENQEVEIIEADDGSGWIKVSDVQGTTGLIPAAYVEISRAIDRSRLPVPSSAANASVTSLVGSVSSGGTHNAGKKVGPTVAPKGSRRRLKHVEALYTYEANGEGQTSMNQGETLVLIAPDSGDGWCEVERAGGLGRGIVPASWVKNL